MDAKLVLDEKYYYLEVQHERIGKIVVGSSDHELSRIVNQPFKLSTKNCDVIKNGYDLDELAEEEAKKRHDWSKHRDTDIYNELVREDAELIKLGFQKALEILGDKKFSEEDVIRAIDVSRQGIVVTKISEWETEKEFDYNETQIIQSLQQTEWDVEIEMEKVTAYTEDGLDYKETRPKLDADGCLILKRK